MSSDAAAVTPVPPPPSRSGSSQETFPPAGSGTPPPVYRPHGKPRPRRGPALWRTLDLCALTIAALPLLLAGEGVNMTAALVFVGIAQVWIATIDHRATHGSFSQVFGPLTGAVALAAVMSVGVSHVLQGGHIDEAHLVTFTIAVGALAALRLVERSSIRRAARSGRGAPTLIVGTGVAANLVAERLRDNTGLGLDPVGFVDDAPVGDASLPLLGSTADMEAVLRSRGVRHVVVAFPRTHHAATLALVERAEAAGAEVLIVPRLYEAFPRRVTVNHLGALPLVSLHPSRPDSPALHVKYAVERVVAGLLLVAFSPVLVAVSIAIRITMGRPVVFRQARVGEGGRIFTIHKFRTMRSARPGESEDGARVTRLGRVLRLTSLDELPQLVNVVRGEMSFVGPRPERPELVEEFAEAIPGYDRRHRVRPGITGWAQVHGIGRGETRFAPKDLRERAEWDNHYIENWSVPMEATIYARTLVALVRHRQGTR